jgi:hypothetical protein
LKSDRESRELNQQGVPGPPGMQGPPGESVGSRQRCSRVRTRTSLGDAAGHIKRNTVSGSGVLSSPAGGGTLLLECWNAAIPELPGSPSGDNPTEVPGTSRNVEAGQRVYTPLVLRGYDLFVLGFSNRFVWRCRSSRLLEHYGRHVGARHLDLGVGTGWFLDRCTWPVETPRITLLDLNENSLTMASQRIRRYRPAAIRANVLDPLELGDVGFDSVGANYLFHCLPGGLESKAATVVSNLRPYIAPRGVFFGSTILGRGVAHNLLGRGLIRLYNRKGIFSNVEDDRRGLELGLASQLTDVEIDVVGAVALFSGRSP